MEISEISDIVLFDLPTELWGVIFEWVDKAALNCSLVNSIWLQFAQQYYKQQCKRHPLKHIHFYENIDFQESWKLRYFYLNSLPRRMVVQTENQISKEINISHDNVITTTTDITYVVKADQPFRRLGGLNSPGIFYYEVTIILEEHGLNTGIGIGMCEKNNRQFPGWTSSNHTESFGYHSDDGSARLCQNLRRRHEPPYGPTFSTGDTVGCLVDFNTQHMLFTKNGNSLGVAFQNIPTEADECYPSIGLKAIAKIEVNFGAKPFVFDLSQHSPRQT